MAQNLRAAAVLTKACGCCISGLFSLISLYITYTDKVLKQKLFALPMPICFTVSKHKRFKLPFDQTYHVSCLLLLYRSEKCSVPESCEPGEQEIIVAFCWKVVMAGGRRTQDPSLNIKFPVLLINSPALWLRWLHATWNAFAASLSSPQWAVVIAIVLKSFSANDKM